MNLQVDEGEYGDVASIQGTVIYNLRIACSLMFWCTFNPHKNWQIVNSIV